MNIRPALAKNALASADMTSKPTEETLKHDMMLSVSRIQSTLIHTTRKNKLFIVPEQNLALKIIFGNSTT